MGTPPAPSYANIYMAKRIDNQIKEIGQKYGQDKTSAIFLLKRFLDDIFQIFIGSTKDLHNFFDEINNIHPTLKFTLSHTTLEYETEEEKCLCQSTESVPFLDTSCSIEDGRIEIDLYRKETNRNQYLSPDSCHSKMVTKVIPFSLSLRIVRICTNQTKRDLRL